MKMKYFRNIGSWVSKNRVEFIVLVFILITASFLRLYKIDQYMTFLGDEGRDAIVVRKLLVNSDLIFVGPGTSIGNMYLGPLYYYLMAPALFLANYNPAGPSIMVALFGIATVYMVWYITRKWFGNVGAIVASFLYAISPVAIIFSRHSWNPNIMPFFSLLTIYSLWKIWQEHKWRWLWVLGFSYAFVLQSHYLGLILLPVIIVFWVLTLRDLYLKKGKTPKLQIKKYLKNTLGLIASFLALMSPLIIFDAKYNWRNLKAIDAFFTERTGVTGNTLTFIHKIIPTFRNVVTRLLAGTEIPFGLFLTITLGLGIIYVLWRLLKDGINKHQNYFFILTWLVIGVLGLSFYKNQIYDHYFGFLFPAPFILLGAFSESFIKKFKIAGEAVVFLLFLALVYVNFSNSPLKTPPSGQMQNTIEVARKIEQEAGGKRYNFAVIADRNYEGAYQYFLELWNTKILIIDPQRYSDTLADQLFVVCEYEDKTKCQPASNPKAEIANFGWSKIENQWAVDGVILFKMIHNYQ